MLITLDRAQAQWNPSRWQNFKPAEMACRCCGEVWWAPDEFDRAQRLRMLLNRPVKFNSTHRCRIHNAKIGGAPQSQHKKIAFDFSMRGVGQNELPTLQAVMLKAGFGTFGLYNGFVHIDSRRGRFWATKAGSRNWSAHFRRIQTNKNHNKVP